MLQWLDKYVMLAKPLSGRASTKEPVVALTNLLSVSVMDMSQGVKAIPVYFPTTVTVANLQTFLTAFAPLLDAAIDAKIVSAAATTQLTLPGGIKTDAVTGNTVHEGALFGFNATGTIYKPSIFFPSWQNAGFAADVALESTPYDDLLAAITAGLSTFQPSDKYANDISGVVGGVRKFRK
jgi:hypothetical protein